MTGTATPRTTPEHHSASTPGAVAGPLHLAPLLWPRHRAGEALTSLARSTRWGRGGPPDAPAKSPDVPLPPPLPPHPGASDRPAHRLDPYLDEAAAHQGLEAEPFHVPYRERACAPEAHLQAPALLQPSGTDHLLAVAAVRSTLRERRADLLAPDGSTVTVPADELLAALELRVLRHHPDATAAAVAVDRILQAAGLAPTTRRGTRPPGPTRARTHLLAARLRHIPVARGWHLRPTPGAPVRSQLRAGGIGPLLGRFLAAHAAQLLLLGAFWWLLWHAVQTAGAAPLPAPTPPARLSPWLPPWTTSRLPDVSRWWSWPAALVLLLATLLPLRLLEARAGGRLALRLGWLLERRLLAGALRLDPDTLLRRGSGRLLGTVMEAEAATSLAVTGGVLALTHALDLALAVPVLWWGSGGGLHLAALVAWTAALAGLAAAHHRARRSWTHHRLALTDDLVEKSAGHRTRLAQEPPTEWHRGEDSALTRHLRAARRCDRLATILAEMPGPGWLLVSLAAVAPAWIGSIPTPILPTSAGLLPAHPATDPTAAPAVSLALALGGTLLAHQALTGLGRTTLAFTDAAVAAGETSFLFRAAGRPRRLGDPAHALTPPALDGLGAPPPPTAAHATHRHGRCPPSAPPRSPLLDARHLAFAHRPPTDSPSASAAPAHQVLTDATFTLRPGDHVLLTGPSGGGKSTLAALITGLRTPDRGTLLLAGLDRSTLGETAWRTAFAGAPQFHENHVLTGSLAFNLLLGRRWPPEPEDLELAEEICRELGLGDLLESMPAGLHQVVGEIGWQLSHGERSRLYIARALLQEAPILVLDESFGTLDPDTLTRCMATVRRRAPTLLVIAHP